MRSLSRCEKPAPSHEGTKDAKHVLYELVFVQLRVFVPFVGDRRCGAGEPLTHRVDFEHGY